MKKHVITLSFIEGEYKEVVNVGIEGKTTNFYQNFSQLNKFY